MSYLPFPGERIKRKLVIVGDQGVGKTSLLMYYATGKPPSQYRPFIYDDYYMTETVDDKHVELWVVDTAGNEDFASQRRAQYADAHVVLLAFSVDNQDSFQSISERWVTEVKTYAPNAVIILLGLRSDSREDPIVIEKMKERGLQFVDVREALTLASDINARTYFECSAHVGVNVHKLFEDAIRGAISIEVVDEPHWELGRFLSSRNGRGRGPATTTRQERRRDCIIL